MPDPRSAPTLDDVAKAAGVSTATVSRCLNTPERVIEDTRRRVMEAVKALGYTPHFGARVMAAKRTFTIGAIIPTMENAMFARGLQAFQEALHAKGYTLLVASSAYSAALEEEQVRALVARGADGLLLIGHDRAGALYEYLQQQEVPALVAWSYVEGAAQACVGFDNHRAMRRLAEEVLALGHQRIAVISAPTAGNDRARLRVEGVKAAVAAQGLAPQALQVIETPYGTDTGAAAFAQLWEAHVRPTAVLCGNDVLAAGAMRAARAKGLEVPRDVSITGFDDLELADILTPTLTTVHVPHRQMGEAAAEALIAMVERRFQGGSVALETSVQMRESLGAPPATG